MSSYTEQIAAVAGTEPDVAYNGDVLTNAADHEFLAALATRLDSGSAVLAMPAGAMAGATADAVDAKLAEARAAAERLSDNLGKIASTAKSASPAISSGTSKQPHVAEALQTSSAVYKALASGDQGGGLTPETDDPEGGEKGADTKGDPKGTDTGATHGATPDGKTPKGTDTPPTTHDREVGKGSSPQTTTSSDQAPQNQQQAQGQPVAQQPIAAVPQQQQAQQPLAGVGGVGGVQQSGAAQRPVGSTSPSGISREDLSRMISEVARGTDRDSGSGASRGIKPERGHTPAPEGTDTGGSTTAVAAVPVGNPSVVGGNVDPAQTAGRTTSTASGAVPAAPPVAARPSASPMGMGTMGGMAPMGPIGSGGGGAAPAAAPPLAVPRDKGSERVFTGEAARDKALISSILHDGEEFTAVDDDEGDEGDDEYGLDERRNPPRDELSDDERW